MDPQSMDHPCMVDLHHCTMDPFVDPVNGLPLWISPYFEGYFSPEVLTNFKNLLVSIFIIKIKGSSYFAQIFSESQTLVRFSVVKE